MWKLKENSKEIEEKLLKNGFDAFTSRILSLRNIENHESFIKSPYEELSHPHSLKNIDKASFLFCKHIKENSTIGLTSDYDADGIISSVMVYELCKLFNKECKVFIPSRFEHGYGLNEKTINSIKEKFKNPPDLLFVLDCGTNNKIEVNLLKEWGIKDIIIIDHHLPSKEQNLSLNSSYLINWHLSENSCEMCTCGEVFQFIRGIRWLTKKIDPIEFLTYAAIGTIADSSPLIKDNRIIIRHGLTEYSLNNVRASGLKILMNTSNIKSSHLTQDDISFKIAPRINAVGRMSDPLLAFKLFTEYDIRIAEELSEDVNTCNTERKKLQSEIEKQAIEQLEKVNLSHGIILKNEQWHIGVLGIVASKIVEETNKPTLIFAYHNGKWKGSGRSPENINIKEILDKCSYIFERYGGHAGAVGCELKKEYENSAQEIFNKVCQEYLKDNNSEINKDKYFDATLKAKSIKENLAILLKEKIAPYYKGVNPEPIFRLHDVYVYNVILKEGDGWKMMLFNAASMEGEIPFGFKYFSPKFNCELEGQKVDIYFKFPQKWDNNSKYEQFELIVTDIEKGKKDETNI